MKWMILLLGLLLAGRASAAPDQALIDAANREGSVVWYTSLLERNLVRPMAQAFEKSYPKIKVQTVIGLQGDLLLRLLNEGKAGGARADVFQGTSIVDPLAKAGLLEAYAPPSAANYPAGFRDPDRFWTVESTLFVGATINTDMVPAADEPHDYQDLLAPKWRGRIAWIAGQTSGGPPGFIGTILLSMGQEKGMAYLRQLAAQQIANVPVNQRQLTDEVIAGQYPLALTTFTHHAQLSAGQGAPVKWLKLQPLTAILDVAVLLKGPHPYAGKLFLDYILSPEGQELFQKAGSIPADPNIPASMPGLKPEDGHFSVELLSPPVLDKGFDSWVAVYNTLFK